MTIIIRVYMLLCASLLLFDICFLLVQNRRRADKESSSMSWVAARMLLIMATSTPSLN